ncbi:Pkinase-domain-containing protein [Terfezia boudieri ATCC MYA-4762]|uniref:non-specific serine/threonine protein kinase n=1 Tax=Terfezia boudieri ATCC MYA-4762 TaxID=1051890 RepID=A0A3N4M8J1_9PEZI|nr:Pkinase-domain-containing protein [Terfezia boudieri ATCC MYA-4762]
MASNNGGQQEDQLIGSYQISHEIGNGSFAKVYKGIAIKTNRVVAIKSVMRAKLNRRLLENLESEIAILTSLKHPHITRLKECIKSRAHIHLVMEYCSMGDLASFIKNREKFASMPITADFAHLYPNPSGGGLNEVIVRHFLKQLASALSFLRSKQLIHRDLKPQNLLLSPPNYTSRSDDGEEMENSDKLVGIVSLPVLKIADFGFARELQVSSLAETLCGSPLYMAPEILRYEKYDAKADLWSLGTVLYEMIAGRPPFRASNHVDLLRKIEEGMDKINFPSKCVASNEIKDLIYGLLKRSPVERMGFAQFFNHSAVQDEIPGAEHVQKGLQRDIPSRRESVAHRDSTVKESPKQSPDRFVHQNEGYQYPKDYRESDRSATAPPAPVLDPEYELPFARTSEPAHSPPPRPTVEQRRVTTPLAREQPAYRPPVPSTSAPVRHEMIIHRAATPMERHTTQNAIPSPSASIMAQQQREAARARADREAARAAHEKQKARERAEHDIIQEYVVIEKRSVEVNAFADELAASPRVGAPTSPTSANAILARRASGRGPSRPSTADRAASQPVRASGNTYSQSPGSMAAHALQRAFSLAPILFFGMGNQQKYSPPTQNVYQYPTPAYHPGSMVMVGGGKTSAIFSEEDQAVINTLEGCASKADVIYHFAAIKYAQLLPVAPNAPQGLSLLPPPGEAAESKVDEDLTPEAIVVLSEQALVLYVKCISLLNKAMQIAGRWWAKSGQDPNGTYGRSPAAERINATVQWIRHKFNEAMEKADYARLRLKEAQSTLPSLHPSHPSNHTFDEPSGSRVGMAVEQDIFISLGVTAERLMFDRAIEMSRGAAVNELVGDDLEGCQVSYLTALKLVEAVLETDEDDGNVDDDDRAYIENGKNHCIDSLAVY